MLPIFSTAECSTYNKDLTDIKTPKQKTKTKLSDPQSWAVRKLLYNTVTVNRNEDVCKPTDLKAKQ